MPLMRRLVVYEAAVHFVSTANRTNEVKIPISLAGAFLLNFAAEERAERVGLSSIQHQMYVFTDDP